MTKQPLEHISDELKKLKHDSTLKVTSYRSRNIKGESLTFEQGRLDALVTVTDLVENVRERQQALQSLIDKGSQEGQEIFEPPDETSAASTVSYEMREAAESFIQGLRHTCKALKLIEGNEKLTTHWQILQEVLFDEAEQYPSWENSGKSEKRFLQECFDQSVVIYDYLEEVKEKSVSDFLEDFCDGVGPHDNSLREVRIYPITEGGNNLILCRTCWFRENIHALQRCLETKNYDGWEPLAWAEAEVYAL